MPYEEHPVTEKPEDENVAIWRYLDFTKFVSLLDRRALFFVRADKIAELDPFEGIIGKAFGSCRRRIAAIMLIDDPIECRDLTRVSRTSPAHEHVEA